MNMYIAQKNLLLFVMWYHFFFAILRCPTYIIFLLMRYLTLVNRLAYINFTGETNDTAMHNSVNACTDHIRDLFLKNALFFFSLNIFYCSTGTFCITS